MAQFRNITDDDLWVATPDGLVKVESDAILTVSDEYAASVYFQTGDTGEVALFEAVASSTAKKTTTTQTAPAEAKE
jgi:hypothetical protein